MADLSIEFCGVKAPNPFWLASGPPTNSEYQVRRAFDAGWGGAVWKTLANEPIVNVSSRYGAVDYDGRKVMGLNNIELITDRPLETNLQEISTGQEGVSRSSAFRVAHGRFPAGSLARNHQEDPGRRRRRHRAQFRLPARHERARHGLGGRPGSRLRVHDHRVGQGGGHDSRDGQADAQCQRCGRDRPRAPCAAGPTRSRSSTRSTRSWASI